MNEFLDRMAEVLEVPVTPETRFRELAGYSSLKGFGLMVVLENEYHRPISISEFAAMSTICDLAAAVMTGLVSPLFTGTDPATVDPAPVVSQANGDRPQVDGDKAEESERK
jgi:acyl carrier protein